MAGSIPSTSDGQSDDPTTLIDGSEIDLTQMGSINSVMGNRMDSFAARKTDIAQNSDMPAMPQQDSSQDIGKPYQLLEGNRRLIMPESRMQKSMDGLC